jgi:hypothetical protein
MKAVGKAVGTNQVHTIWIYRPLYVFNVFGVLYGVFHISLGRLDVQLTPSLHEGEKHKQTTTLMFVGDINPERSCGDVALTQRLISPQSYLFEVLVP